MSDPLLIVFTSQTGNAGKSILATALGVELSTQGYDTVVIDADHEHRKLGWSSHTWARDDRKPNHPHRECFASVMADDGNAIAQEIEAHMDADFIIIDCPSRAGLTTFKIAAIADLVVFPIPTGVKDFRLSRNTVKTMLTGIQPTKENRLQVGIPPIPPQHIAIVPTRAHSIAEAKAAEAWLRSNCPSSDQLHIHPPLMERAAYANAIARGLAITEATPQQLATKARLITSSIIAQANRIKPTAIKKLEAA